MYIPYLHSNGCSFKIAIEKMNYQSAVTYKHTCGRKLNTDNLINQGTLSGKHSRPSTCSTLTLSSVGAVVQLSGESDLTSKRG